MNVHHPTPEYTRSMNTMNYTEIVANLEYMRTVLAIQYRWKMVGITSSKSEVKLKQKMIPDCREYKY